LTAAGRRGRSARRRSCWSTTCSPAGTPRATTRPGARPWPTICGPPRRRCALLDAGLDNPVAKASGLCYDLLLHWPALWTFATVPGVEPTNNAAERALRPAVLWRKGSFGTQSADGNLFVARILSVAATCKRHHRSLLAYLTEVCTAARYGHPIRSLLPIPA